MIEKRFGALSSSVDPNKLALSVQGALTAVTGGLVFFGVLSVTDADTLATAVAALVPLAIAAYGLCQTIIGILRKVLIFFATR